MYNPTNDSGIDDEGQRYRLLVESILDHAVMLLDAGGFIKVFNAGATRTLGYNPGEVVGRHFSVLYPKEDIEAGIPAAVLARAKDTSVLNEEGWRIRKDGTRIRAAVSLSAIKDQDQNILGYTKVLRDVSNRHRDALMLRSVIDHTIDGIITIDDKGTIKTFNHAAKTIFGYDESEVVGRNVKMLMPEPYHGEHDGYLGNYLKSREAKIIGIGREVIGRRKDGSTFPMELAVSEFTFDGHLNFTGMVRDITGRRKLEAQLYQSQKMEAIGRLAGGIAHDFNNLLTIIGGYSEVLLTRLPQDNALHDLARQISDASERASGLTRQLLAFGRQTVLEPKLLDLNAVVIEMEKLLARMIGEDIEIAMNLDPQVDRVRVDPHQFGQVIMNLAVNARDAMPQGGKLTIESRNVDLDESYTAQRDSVAPGSYVMLAISDTGIGMDPATKARLFEPFFTTKAPGKGTGLGLSVVYGIIKQSGGHIEAYSEVGKGSTFKVYLPQAQSQPARNGNRPAKPRAQAGNETILLVEDDANVRSFIVMALQSHGYQVIAAETGKEAIALAAKHRDELDLLLTDVVMPVLSGRQVAEAVHQLIPDLKVLYLSGYTDDAVVRHGLVEAQVSFLQKPFSIEALGHKVRQVLDEK